MHGTYLTVFFKEMNRRFPNEWCVLHSYETLPQHSESDVDMAFSGTDISALEMVIVDVAKNTGWILYQKLWYDVESCFYYVLKQNGADVFLALDFLIDNGGIGKYGFKTSILTSQCIMTPNQFPIPNPEVAFSYKLIKRIVKKKSLLEDKQYLMQQYILSDSKKIDLFLTAQFGNRGNERITSFLTIKQDTLMPEEIDTLNKKRTNITSDYHHKFQYLVWQVKRVTNRIFYPSGMIIYIPKLKIEQMELLKVELEARLDILFRFMCLNPSNSIKINLTSFVGSTLVLCPLKNHNHKKLIRYNWFSRKSVDFDIDTKNDIKMIADKYSSAILDALKMRIENRIVSTL